MSTCVACGRELQPDRSCPRCMNGKEDAITARCTRIADVVVPTYRGGTRSYPCTGTVAKRWQAAWDGACVALGHDPESFRIRLREDR